MELVFANRSILERFRMSGLLNLFIGTEMQNLLAWTQEIVIPGSLRPSCFESARTMRPLSVLDANQFVLRFVNPGRFEKQQETKQKPRRSVSFSNHVEYREIPHISSYTDEAIDAVWHAAEDYQLFRSMCNVTVRMMENGENLQDDQDFWFRGLVSEIE
jgi:hypothetical protein